MFGKDPVWKAFFFQSWGRLPRELEEMIGSRHSIWINTEAGGELTQIFSLCKMVKKQLSEFNLLVSTHKYEAYLLAQEIDGVDYAFFSPWDITWVVRKVLKKINPALLIASEIVTAPVLFREASHLGIKTFLCSAFMSKNLENNKILERAMALKFHKQLNFIGVKQRIDREGFKKMGYPEDSIKILGDLKYDVTKMKVLGKSRVEWLTELGLESEDKVLLGGSMHHGEEKFLIDAYALLRKQDSKFRLVIAPRYTQFINHIEAYLKVRGFPFIKRTEIKKAKDSEKAVIIIDTFGELAYLYAVASYAVIGSSIFPADPLGGHNIIEPMVHEIPIFFGPHMLKAQEVTNELNECWDGLEVHSPEQLAQNILFLDKNKVLKDKIKNRTKEIVSRHKNSAENHAKFIEKFLIYGES